MKKLLLISLAAAAAVILVTSCTSYTCPTYAKTNKKNNLKDEPLGI